jgi:hypothetical protein
MKFSLGCSLVYHLPTPMPFVFNVEVASFTGQSIEQEQFVFRSTAAGRALDDAGERKPIF